MAAFLYFVVALLSALGAWLYEPVRHFVAVLGVRPFSGSANIHGVETRLIPDTVGCEDLEYHASSGMLYTACVGDIEIARGWNPGAEALARPVKSAYGTIVVIDPTTQKSKKLSLENFEGPFATHGIGLYTPPSKPEMVYIYAINHLPNPAWTAGSKTEDKAASQVELFVHTVGSDKAQHLRSIAHPLIRTPNDLLAISENEFLVTNDHYYREGPMRLVEELVRGVQSWTDLVHVRFGDGDEKIDAAVVLDSIATNNGLGWGPDQQVIIGDAVGGYVYFASLPSAENRTMTVSHRHPVDCVVDNANFFADPYAGVDGKDYSGYLLPGVFRRAEIRHGLRRPELPGAHPGPGVVPAGDRGDDGHAIRSVTTAVIVAIDPATNDGKREGWLFVTSVIGSGMLATKIDFETALV
ncbi:hypothetical protein CHU98_g9805 [Xylaria longipes]|nr:hypothetical protein CHU98_g9805 [Xylaria longipes]